MSKTCPEKCCAGAQVLIKKWEEPSKDGRDKTVLVSVTCPDCEFGLTITYGKGFDCPEKEKEATDLLIQSWSTQTPLLQESVFADKAEVPSEEI